MYVAISLTTDNIGFDLVKQLNLGLNNFFRFGVITNEFPYLNYGGYLVTFSSRTAFLTT